MAETLVKVPGRQRPSGLVRQCRGDSGAVWNEPGGAVGGGRADILLGPEAISAAGTHVCVVGVGLFWWIPAVVILPGLVWVGCGVWWGFGVG